MSLWLDTQEKIGATEIRIVAICGGKIRALVVLIIMKISHYRTLKAGGAMLHRVM